MKQFIGNVNGVEYTDKDAFNEAAKKAMLENNGVLAITSYEKYIPDVEKEQLPPVEPEKKIIVDENDFVIERESDKETIDGKLFFVIPDEVTEKIKNCDNKEEVERMLRKCIDAWSRFYGEDDRNLFSYEEELKKLETKIEQKRKDVEEDEAGIRYYKTLLGYLNGRKPICKCGEKKDEGNTCSGLKREENEDRRRMGDILEEVTSVFDNFSSYLRKKGFF